MPAGRWDGTFAEEEDFSSDQDDGDTDDQYQQVLNFFNVHDTLGGIKERVRQPFLLCLSFNLLFSPEGLSRELVERSFNYRSHGGHIDRPSLHHAGGEVGSR